MYNQQIRNAEAQYFDAQVNENVYNGDSSLAETYHEIVDDVFPSTRQPAVAHYFAQHFCNTQKEQQKFMIDALQPPAQ